MRNFKVANSLKDDCIDLFHLWENSSAALNEDYEFQLLHSFYNCFNNTGFQQAAEALDILVEKWNQISLSTNSFDKKGLSTTMFDDSLSTTSFANFNLAKKVNSLKTTTQTNSPKTIHNYSSSTNNSRTQQSNGSFNSGLKTTSNNGSMRTLLSNSRVRGLLVRV